MGATVHLKPYCSVSFAETTQYVLCVFGGCKKRRGKKSLGCDVEEKSLAALCLGRLFVRLGIPLRQALWMPGGQLRAFISRICSWMSFRGFEAFSVHSTPSTR